MAYFEREVSKKRKFVADGVFYSELNELFATQLAEDGYAGLEVRVTPARTEIIIKATRTQDVLGENGQRIREMTSCGAEAIQLPRGRCGNFCRARGEPWSVRADPGRISKVQASWWPCCASCLLRSVALRHGGRRERCWYLCLVRCVDSVPRHRNSQTGI